MPLSFRPCLAILVAALLLSPSSFAFDSPLSDQAVREAYFLGQRHDESLARLLDRYTTYLAPPKTGPHSLPSLSLRRSLSSPNSLVGIALATARNRPRSIIAAGRSP